LEGDKRWMENLKRGRGEAFWGVPYRLRGGKDKPKEKRIPWRVEKVAGEVGRGELTDSSPSRLVSKARGKGWMRSRKIAANAGDSRRRGG